MEESIQSQGINQNVAQILNKAGSLLQNQGKTQYDSTAQRS